MKHKGYWLSELFVALLGITDWGYGCRDGGIA